MKHSRSTKVQFWFEEPISVGDLAEKMDAALLAAGVDRTNYLHRAGGASASSAIDNNQLVGASILDVIPDEEPGIWAASARYLKTEFPDVPIGLHFNYWGDTNFCRKTPVNSVRIDFDACLNQLYLEGHIEAASEEDGRDLFESARYFYALMRELRRETEADWCCGIYEKQYYGDPRDFDPREMGGLGQLSASFFFSNTGEQVLNPMFEAIE